MANFCENCGSPVQSDNRFCSNCGAPVNHSDSDVPVTSSAAPAIGRSPTASAPTAVAATVTAATATAHGKTQDTFVPPQPQRDTVRPAMQHHPEPPQQHMVNQNAQQPPMQPHYGPQTPG